MWIDLICWIGLIIAVLMGIGLIGAIALAIAMAFSIRTERFGDKPKDRSEK